MTGPSCKDLNWVKISTFEMYFFKKLMLEI